MQRRSRSVFSPWCPGSIGSVAIAVRFSLRNLDGAEVSTSAPFWLHRPHDSEIIPLRVIMETEASDAGTHRSELDPLPLPMLGLIDTPLEISRMYIFC